VQRISAFNLGSSIYAPRGIKWENLTVATASHLLGGHAANSRSPKVNLLIADESRMGCQLLQHALSRTRYPFEIAGCAVSRSEMLSSLKNTRVDVALINQGLEEGPLVGFQMLQEMREAYPHTRVVMLLKNPTCELVVDAFRGGAKGVFCRTESFETLCKCIQSVHRGQVWANSDQLHFLLEAFVRSSPLRAVDYAGRPLLTRREDEVATLLAEGLSNKAVCEKLKLSEHTVSNYLYRIYNKLGVSSRVELVLYLLRQRQKA
jgi:two-component system, NarL family, nitrate/nitrite response regulator NarL